MSFFIRKKGQTALTKAKTSQKSSPSKFTKNSDAKRRPVKRNRGGSSSGSSRAFEKRSKFDPNEEISSESSDEETASKSKQLEHFGIDEAEDEDAAETAQEKKLRLAKLYLEEIEREEKERADDDEHDLEEDNLAISNRLREDVLESEGKLRRDVSSKISVDLDGIKLLRYPKFMKKSVTSLCISPDNSTIYSGCKDGHLYKWSVEEGKKIDMVKRKEKVSKKKKNKQKLQINGSISNGIDGNSNSVHSSAISAIAISSDGKYLATGDLDRQVVIWNPTTLKRIHIFTGHRGPIRGLVFRSKTHTLYSSSDDRSVRIWSIDDMGYVETLFGHQDAVTSIDALARERCVSAGGRDNTIRVWKIVEESQLIYNGHYNGSVDVVKLVNEENFISGGDDGHLCLWHVNRKKPIAVKESAHGVDKGIPNWISSLAAWNNTDLIASGSCNGWIKLWKIDGKNLVELTQIKCDGWINSMEFSYGNELKDKFLVVGIGKEHKSGRWFNNSKSEDGAESVKNSIMVIPLKPVQS